MKKLLIALLAGVGLSGCVAYPAYDAPGYYYGPAVSVGIGTSYGYRGDRGDRGHRGHRYH